MTNGLVPSADAMTAYANTLDLFDAVVATDGDREAFVDGDRRITFGEWAEAADAVSAWLAARGVGHGDVVGIHLPSSIDYAIAYQAVMRRGAITSGMNPRLGAGETDHILRASGASVVFSDTLPGGVSTTQLRDIQTGSGRVGRPDLSLTDTVAIVWTSGTTGYPKGAVFDHGCLQAMTAGAGPLSQLGDRRLSPLPFAHIGYMTRVWDELWHRITTIIVPTPWTAAGALELIARERVTVGQGVPAQWQMMLNHPSIAELDTSSLRLVGTGAARVPPELVLALKARFGCEVVVRYASTEACLATGTKVTDPVEVIANSVGKPGAGVELKLVDADGAPVARGDVGTVCLRSRAMMRGYWNDPERTQEAFDADGFLVTGDLGFLDDADDLHLAGRRTEMYIRGGYNVYPIEVENCLGAHPDVVKVAVLGASAPVLGEIGVAFVVTRPGAELTLDALRSYVKTNLADYKAPDALVIVDDIPLTSMSKVDKKALVPAALDAATRWQR
jgi:acyl-CoA synthetase (AMP-forming)/AMP-acid ligase II